MDKSLAITGEDGGVYGIPYVVEGYGIIYNDAIMQKYFAQDGAKAAVWMRSTTSLSYKRL